MGKDATQKGVSEAKEAEGTEVDERTELMDKIADQSFEERKQDEVVEEEPEEETEGEESEEETEETEEEETEEEEEPEEEMVELVIDGEKQQVPASKVHDAGVRTLQKKEAADKKLEEASKLYKDLESLKKEFNEQFKQPSEDVATDSPESDKVLNEARKELVNAQYEGTPDELSAAMDKYEKAMLDMVKSSTDQSDVQQTVQDEITKSEIRRKFQLPGDQGGFVDLYEDPDYYAMVCRRVDELIGEGHDGKDWKVYHQAGTEVRQKLKDTWGQSVADGKNIEEDDMTKKVKKKKKLDPTKAASGKSGAKKEEKPKTARDVINDLKKGRGQED